MDTEKKPKRPRIGASLDINQNAETTNRYEKINYSVSGQDSNDATSSRNFNNRPYQPRNYEGNRPSNYQPRYNQNRGGYQNHYNSGYQTSDYKNRMQAEGTNTDQSQTKTEQGEGQTETNHGYHNYQSDYRQNQYGNRQQGGYNNNRQQNGYSNRQQGGYNNNRQQNGYNNNRQQNGYNNNRQQNGYNNNRQQNGYNNNRQQNGYNNNRQQGGYNNRQKNGYNNRQQQGGYKKNQGMRFTPRPKQVEYVLDDFDPTQPIRLNKFMSNAGICSRREADEYITAGKVKVNGNVVTELGVKITAADIVEYDEKIVTPEKKCYILLNKPKDCVTTSDDPNGRTTVLDLVKNACKERIYPVGRLDRNTTGVLLLTNDGDLASKLTHPKFVKKKIYHVWTDKDITEEHMQQIADGIELEDGEIHADAISYVSDTDRNQAGIEIHSGRNRIVRRIFESLGYRVTKLDRVYFAGLTKKNLPRGRWRYLTQEEVNFLRMGSFE